MFGSILLENEQRDLLCVLVEAARNVPREERQMFFVIQAPIDKVAEIKHQGLANSTLNAYMGDIEVLAREGLIYLSHDQFISSFDVLPLGFKYYEYMKQQGGQPLQNVTTQVQSYLAAEPFRTKYHSAYQKWAQADALLWASETQTQLTTIGHICREALQEFTTVLVIEFQPSNVDQDPAHTISRIRAVLDLQINNLGSTEKPLLEALLEYWGTVNDIVQRQEHGAQKDGKPLAWEDGRRVVFQTAIVMLEISTSLRVYSRFLCEATQY